jgi:CheY-like chemotaxis protein
MGNEAPVTRSIAIVAVTTLATKGEKEKCLEASMDDSVTKSIKRNLFLKQLKSW